MCSQAFPQNFPERQQKFVNEQGILTGDGFYLLLALFNRTGKGSGIIPVVILPLTATGIDQGSALQLVNDWNDVEAVPVNSGVVLLPLKPGQDQQVFNGDRANALNVYPPPGVQIDALGVNAPFVLAISKLRIFEFWSLTQIRSFGN